MKRTNFFSKYRALLGIAMFALVQPLQAATLGLTEGFPDFTLADGQSYIYDVDCDGALSGQCVAGQGKLTITGAISGYTEVGPGGTLENTLVTASSFSLEALFDVNTETFLSGSFNINGVVRHPGFTPLYDGSTHGSGLLSGNLDLFGFTGKADPSTGGKLEFTFNNADGYIADPLFEKLELGFVEFLAGGMILNVATSSFGAGAFAANVLTSDWTGDGNGNVYVPIPATAWLFFSGMGVLFGFARRRRQ